MVFFHATTATVAAAMDGSAPHREAGKVFYYNDKTEVDFFLPESKIAIQASYSLLEDSTRFRELKAIILLHSFIKLNKAYIVTWDTEETVKQDDLTIHIVPIWKWLLQDLV